MLQNEYLLGNIGVDTAENGFGKVQTRDAFQRPPTGEVALEAAVNDFSALHFAADGLKHDRDFVLKALRRTRFLNDTVRGSQPSLFERLCFSTISCSSPIENTNEYRRML